MFRHRIVDIRHRYTQYKCDNRTYNIIIRKITFFIIEYTITDIIILSIFLFFKWQVTKS